MKKIFKVLGTTIVLAVVGFSFTACPPDGPAGCTHQWELESVEEEPTCTEEGLGTRVCALCEEIDDNYILPTVEHDWGEWEITIEPTVSVEGEQTRICSVCGETDEGFIPVLQPTQGLLFTLKNNDTAYSVSRGTATATEVVIPAVHNGLPVTEIGSDGFSNSAMTSILIPDSVTYIGWGAFWGCTDLTNITIPNSVIGIGGYAFNGCTGLTSITIPASVTNIGGGAFAFCTGLTSITIPASVTNIGEGAFAFCTGLESITVDSGNTVYRSEGNCIIQISDNMLIAGCKNSVIPSGVTGIAFSAFNGCTGLTNITIPDSVTNIGGYAFKDCTGLTSIIIPDSVTYIGWGAFQDCTGLTSITIPDSVTSIGSSAFSGCTGLTNITIPDSVTSIGGQAFYRCTGLTSVTLGTITEDNFGTNYAFPGNLREVYFADGGGAGTYTTTNPGWTPTWTKQE